MAKAKSQSDRRPPPLAHDRLLGFVYLGSFLDDWTDLGLDDDDLRELEKLIHERPNAGVVMSGTGGLRKVRFAPAKGNKGKSGSARVCYALFPRPGMVFMVMVFGKNDKDNLDPAERNMVKLLIAAYEAFLAKKGGRK